MLSSTHHPALPSFHLRYDIPAIGTTISGEQRENREERWRRRELKKVDRELSKGNLKTALSMVNHLQGNPGGLSGFGSAKQVPQRLSSLDGLKLNGVDTTSLQLLVDSIIESIEKSIQFTLLDEVPFTRQESLMHDEGNEPLCQKNHLMCMQHEAGHFLVGYLLGVLPRGYKVPSIEDMRQDEFAGGRVEFVGFDFLKEVNFGIERKKFNKGKPFDRAKGAISSKTLNRYSCVILGGLVAEFLLFGYSEGLHSDVDQLDRVLKWLGFTELEANSHVKWAVLNTVLILSHHHEARSRLAEAMASTCSIGFCIDTIENAINQKEI